MDQFLLLVVVVFIRGVNMQTASEGVETVLVFTPNWYQNMPDNSDDGAKSAKWKIPSPEELLNNNCWDAQTSAEVARESCQITLEIERTEAGGLAESREL